MPGKLPKAVLFLFLSLFPFTAQAAVFFSDGFEAGGYASWTGSWVESGCSLSADASLKKSGTYSLRCDDPSTTSGGASLSENLPASANLYIRYYVYFSTGFFSTITSSSGVREIMRIPAAGGSYFYLELSYNGSSLIKGGTWEHSDFAGTLQDNRWYCFEVKLPSCTASSTVQWWVDGATQTAITGVNLADQQYWTSLKLGLHYSNKPLLTQRLYLDDVVIADSYIGPVSGGTPPPPATTGWTTPCQRITDGPNSAWRGQLLDPARQMRPVTLVKQYIDIMSKHKMNVLHMHFIDGSGWTLESSSYSLVSAGHYYTKAEVADLVAYASRRFVTILPEFEGPGHSSRACSRIPAIRCAGDPSGATMCVSKEETYTFMQSIFDEFVPMFPGNYVHIGADEVSASYWNNCPSCSAYMASHSYDTTQMYLHYVQRIQQMITAKGKKSVIWWELKENTDGWLDKDNTVLHQWRSWQVSSSATHISAMLSSGWKYIDSNYAPLYYSHDFAAKPLALLDYTHGGAALNNYPSAQLGIESCSWGDRAENTEDRVLMPRLMSTAEHAWSHKSAASVPDFMGRLAYHMLDNMETTPAEQHGIAGSSYVSGRLNSLTTNSGDPLYYLKSATTNYLLISGYPLSYYSNPIASPVLPTPDTITARAGNMTIDGNTQILYVDSAQHELADVADFLRERILAVTGLNLTVAALSGQARPGIIVLASNKTSIPAGFLPGDAGSLSGLGKEDYFLDVADKTILYGGEEAGTFYAAQTLLQTLKIDEITVVPATKIICSASPDATMQANGTDLTTVSAALCGDDDLRIYTATGSITFSITGSATWEDGTTGNKTLPAAAGLASIVVRSSTTAGTATVTASAAGLASGSITLTISVPVTEPPVNEVKVGPNPFIPGVNGSAMNFSNLEENSTLKIYTLSGKLVRAMVTETGMTEISWDGKNRLNNPLSAGIYLYVVTGTTGPARTGKLLIR